MKSIPTVLASKDGSCAVKVLAFEGADRIPNRDAVGYYFVLENPEKESVRVGVVFSGTVMMVSPEAYGLPLGPDRTTTFTGFGLAAIGEELDREGVPEQDQNATTIPHIECLSPHFEEWGDRSPATDEEVEKYIQTHLFWAWKLGEESWELGMPDLLRLGQTMADVDRIIQLCDGEEWDVAGREPDAVRIKARNSLLRTMREGERPKMTSGSREGRSASVPDEEPSGFEYVDELRLADLRRLDESRWDLRKLIALCGELNVCYRSQCYHAVAALTRAILDHVPPIFECASFAEVANNYGGGRSFKACMERLQEAGRRIADMHLHQQVRSTESLPTRTQVNFSNELDMLLAEIIRIIEAENGSSA